MRWMTIYPERQTGHLIYVSFKGCFYTNVSKYSLVTVYYITLKPDLLKKPLQFISFQNSIQSVKKCNRISPLSIQYFIFCHQKANHQFLLKCISFTEMQFTCVCACSVMSDCATPWNIVHHAPLSTGLSRQEIFLLISTPLIFLVSTVLSFPNCHTVGIIQ